MSHLSDRGHPSRAEFFRSGAATALGIAAAVSPPLRKSAFAADKAVIRVGYIDSFSGYNAATAYSQSSGMHLALEEANKRNSRVRFEVVQGDDMNDSSVGLNEAKRLIEDEKVDVLAGLTSTAVALKVMEFAERAGVFLLQVGTSGTSITGSQASRVSFRTTCSNQMLADALAPLLLERGKIWFFITVDYEFGRDAQAHLTRALLAGGGRVGGSVRHRNGETDFGRYMDLIARSEADVIVLCSSGADAQNALSAVMREGLHESMQLAGVLLDNENVIGLPIHALVGSLWGYVWGPDAGGPRTREIYGKLKARARGFPSNWNQYLGYIAGEQLAERILGAGTTDTSRLIDAFEDERPFDAGKSHGSFWRRCDHQLVQDTYVACIVPTHERINTYEFFRVAHTLPAGAVPSCSSRDALAATHRMQMHPIAPRRDYSVPSF